MKTSDKNHVGYTTNEKIKLANYVYANQSRIYKNSWMDLYTFSMYFFQKFLIMKYDSVGINITLFNITSLVSVSEWLIFYLHWEIYNKTNMSIVYIDLIKHVLNTLSHIEISMQTNFLSNVRISLSLSTFKSMFVNFRYKIKTWCAFTI